MNVSDAARLDNDELFTSAMSALARGDWAGVDQSLRLFGSRRTRKAACKGRELRAAIEKRNSRCSSKALEKPGVWTSRSNAGAYAKFVGAVTDHAIPPLRERLIKRARHSIWLSSLTAPSQRVSQLLERKAPDVHTVLVVAARKVRGRKQREVMARLEAAGVDCRRLDSTHSKLAVIDGEFYMNGSANLDGAHRDFCEVRRDRAMARKAIAYIDALR